MWKELTHLSDNERSKISAMDSTLLSILAQLEVRDKKFDDEQVQRYFKQITLESSKKLAKDLFAGGKDSEGLRKWARSLSRPKTKACTCK